MKNASESHVKSKAETQGDAQAALKPLKIRVALASFFGGQREHQKNLTNSNNTDSDETRHNGPKKWWSQLALENPYEDILMETRLLHEVKDILDELNILKNLAQLSRCISFIVNGKPTITSRFPIETNQIFQDNIHLSRANNV